MLVKTGKRSFADLETKDDNAATLAKARLAKKVKKTCLKIPYPQGHKFTLDDKKNVLHIFHTLQTHKSFTSLKDQDLHELTGILYGCSKPTVTKIVNTNGDYKDNRYNRFIQGKEIPEEFQDIFKDEIRKNLEKGVRLTAGFFKQMLFDNNIIVSLDTVIRKMREWGLRWGSLTEKDYRRKTAKVLLLREQYLKTLEDLEKDSSRKRVYIDESYIHKHHSFTKGWYIPSEGKELFKPFGLGSRIAIIAAITQDSWLGIRPQNIKSSLSVERINSIHQYKSIKYWQIKSKETGNVIADVFKDYFETCVIPYLPPESIVILDNASYHRRYSAGVFKPKQATKKADLIRYLESKGETITKAMLKPELLTKAKLCFQGTKTEIQEMAEEYGHTVLYLPPYHPELNPIEFAWGRVKNDAGEAAAYDVDKIAKEVLPEAFANLTPEVITNLFNHVKKTELNYRKVISRDDTSSEVKTVDEVTTDEDSDFIFDDNISFSESGQDTDDNEPDTDIEEEG